MIYKEIKRLLSGSAYLNFGCGPVFSPEWNNLDLYRSKDVIYHDVTRGLPYPDGSFDAVYSSHVFEHLSKNKGEVLLKEIFRVLKSRGIIRLVLPDLEGIVKEYLKNLEAYRCESTKQNWQRYYWSILELYDQATREVTGGEMLKVLKSGDVDFEYIAKRNGDEFRSFYPWVGKESVKNLPFVKKILPKLKSLFRSHNPRKLGEAHCWMYDDVSLSNLLKECGLVEISKKDWNKSDISDWQKFNLDGSDYGQYPRRPDSMYLEAKKP